MTEQALDQFKKFSIEVFDKTKHMDVYNHWFLERQSERPDDALLSPTGLVVNYMEQPVCIGFLCRTDSKMALLTNFISDPKANKEIRSDCLDLMIIELTEIAKAEGNLILGAASAIPAMYERFAKHGMIKTHENMVNYRENVMPWMAVAGAALGAIAGGQKDKSTQSSEQTSDVQLKDYASLNRGRSDLEAMAEKYNIGAYGDLNNLLNQGPGAQDVTAGLNQTRSYADLLQQMQASGGQANQQQIGQAQQYAQAIFAPQQVAMQQAFGDQNIAQQRLAARLGRGGADPVLRAKLGQEQTRQQAMLQAQQGAFGAEYAQQLPQRQLSLAQTLADVRGGLATQALQNRQTLLGLGQSINESERNYRLGTASRSGTSNQTNLSGGGTAGAIAGGLGGFGSGLSAFSKMGK